jgi:hypothetical protein
MSFNLLRNSRVFFTTAVGTSGAALGVVGGAGAPAVSSTNTREIQVLDGFGFSQNTTSETVTLNETGDTPVRGQRSFNTQLDPVDFNMTTYIRPKKATAVTGGAIDVITLSSTANTNYSAATTQIIISQPNTAGGTQAILRPIFTSGALTGIQKVNAGTGYTGTEQILIVDTDAPTASENVTATFTTTGSISTSSNKITAEESVLWNALFAVDPIGGAAPAWAETSSSATCVATNSNKHQLQRFGLIILIDTACFVIDDCVLNTATIDFGIDAIASIQWSGQGKAIRQIAAPATSASGSFTYSGSDTVSTVLFGGTTYTQKITDAAFIANKLSVVRLQRNLTGSSAANSNEYYNLPLTGGNLTISNNVSYLTPANLGTVNTPVTYFAGTRAISGSLTAYLRSGTTDGSDNSTNRKQTAQLLGDMLTASATDVDPAFRMLITVGGSNTDKVELNMPGVVLTIPTIATEQVISTTINFTAQGVDSGSSDFKLENTNELDVTYYA